MSTEAEPRVLREVVLSQLATGESRAYKMWLPPLTDPTPVNELVERDYQRRPLRFGLGIMDEPRRHRQEVWGVDVSAAGGNIAVGGAPQTGKSTFLQTLVVSAAATHTPRQVQFYCVDLGGGGLMYLEDLPHVGGVATRAEPDRVNRVVAEVKAVLRAREQVFKQYRVGSIASYREMRDDPNNPASQDPFGDVFLVIDGWPAFVAEFPDLEPAVQDIAGQGLAYGVHVIITTPRWTELKSRVRDYLGTKIEFRLGDVNETQIDRITREIPANRPGRAVSLEKHHLMMGVPRLDGVHSADNIVEAISSAVQQIADRHTDQAPQVRVLPERIYLHQLDPNPPGPDSDYRTRWQVPLGVRESDLTVAYNQMHLTPHLLIFGAPKSGKTRIAHAVAQAICKRNSPQQVRFMLADYRSGLLDAVPQSHLLDAGAINRNSATLEEAIKALAVNLKKRQAWCRPWRRWDRCCPRRPTSACTSSSRARCPWPTARPWTSSWVPPTAQDHPRCSCPARRTTSRRGTSSSRKGPLARHSLSVRTEKRSSRRPTWTHPKKKCSHHLQRAVSICSTHSATLAAARQQRDRGTDSLTFWQICARGIRVLCP